MSKVKIITAEADWSLANANSQLEEKLSKVCEEMEDINYELDSIDIKTREWPETYEDAPSFKVTAYAIFKKI